MKSLEEYTNEIFKFLKENAQTPALEQDANQEQAEAPVIDWNQLATEIEKFKTELAAAGFETIDAFLESLQPPAAS